MMLSSRRVPALDGLRGAAVLAVILHHLAGYLPPHGLVGKAVGRAFFAGWSGVDLFFVLSGFLITGILLDAKGSANYFKAFYARRVLRIFPLYYGVLSAVVLYAACRPGHWPNAQLPIPHDRFLYFVYLNNWWPLLKDTWHANILGHFWSLAVEEQFYLLWPVCVWLLPFKKVAPVASICIAAALLLRCFLYVHFGPIRDIVENVFTRMDSLFAGAFMAALVRLPETLRRVKPFVLAGAGVCGAAIVVINLAARAFTNSEWYVIVAFSLFACSFGGLILHSFLTSQETTLFQTALRNKPLTIVGKYSYGMYVYHVPLIAVASALIARPLDVGRNWFGSACFIVGVVSVTFLVAKLSFDFFESRFLRLKSGFAFKREEPAAPLLAKGAGT